MGEIGFGGRGGGGVGVDPNLTQGKKLIESIDMLAVRPNALKLSSKSGSVRCMLFFSPSAILVYDVRELCNIEILINLSKTTLNRLT